MPGEYLRGHATSVPRGEHAVTNGTNAHVYVMSDYVTTPVPFQQPQGTPIQEMRESSQNANSNNIYGNNQSYNFSNGPQTNGIHAQLARNHPPQITSSQYSDPNGGIDTLRPQISSMIGLQQFQFTSVNARGTENRPRVNVPQQRPAVIAYSASFMPKTSGEFKTPEVPRSVNNKTKETVKQVTAHIHRVTDLNSPKPSATFSKELIDFIQSPRIPDRFDEEEDQEEAKKFWVCDPDVYKKEQESRNMNGQQNLSSKNLFSHVAASNGIATFHPITVNAATNQTNATHSTHTASNHTLKERPVSVVVSALQGSSTVVYRSMVRSQVATKSTSVIGISEGQKSVFDIPFAKNSRRKTKPRIYRQKGTQVIVDASKMRAGSKVNGKNLPSRPDVDQAAERGVLDEYPIPKIVSFYSLNPSLPGKLNGKDAPTGASHSTFTLSQPKVVSPSSYVDKNAKALQRPQRTSSYDESITRVIAKAKALVDANEAGFNISVISAAGISKRSNSTSPTIGSSRNIDVTRDAMRRSSTEPYRTSNTSQINTTISAKQPLPSPSSSLESWFSSKQTKSLDMHVVGTYPSPIVISKKSPPSYEYLPVISTNQQSSMKHNPLGYPERMKTTSKPNEMEFRIIYSKTLEIPRSSRALPISSVVSSPLPLPQDQKQAVVKTPSSRSVSNIVWNTSHASSSTIQFERQHPAQLHTTMSSHTASQQIPNNNTTKYADSGKATSNILDEHSVGKALDSSLSGEPSCMEIPDEPLDYSMKTLLGLERDSQPCDIYQDVALDLSMPKDKKLSMNAASFSQHKTPVTSANTSRFDKPGMNQSPVVEVPVISDDTVNLPPSVPPAPIDTSNLQTLCSVALSAQNGDASVESSRSIETETPSWKDRSCEVQLQQRSSRKERQKVQKIVSQPVETSQPLTNIVTRAEKNGAVTQNVSEIRADLKIERKELAGDAVTTTENIPLETGKTRDASEDMDRKDVEALAGREKETITATFDGQSFPSSRVLDGSTVSKPKKNGELEVADLSHDDLEGIEKQEGSKDSIPEQELYAQISSEDDPQACAIEEMTKETKVNDAADVQQAAMLDENLKVESPNAELPTCEETPDLMVKSPISVGDTKSEPRVNIEVTGKANEEITRKQTTLAMDVNEPDSERSQNVEAEIGLADVHEPDLERSQDAEAEIGLADDGIEQKQEIFLAVTSQIEKSLCQKESGNVENKNDTLEVKKKNEDQVVNMDTSVVPESQPTVIHEETVERILQSEKNIKNNVAEDLEDTNNEDAFHQEIFKIADQKNALLDDISKGRSSPNVTLHRLNSDEMRNKFSVSTENEIVNIRPESLNTIIKAKLMRDILSSDEDVKNKKVNPMEETEQDKSYPLKQGSESAEVLAKSMNVPTAETIDESDFTSTRSADAAQKELITLKEDTPEVVDREISSGISKTPENDGENVVQKEKCLTEEKEQESASLQELRKGCPPISTTVGSPKASEKSQKKDKCRKIVTCDHPVVSNKFQDQKHAKDEETKDGLGNVVLNDSEVLFFGIRNPSKKTFPHQRSFSENQELLEMDEACCDEYDNMFMTEDESGDEESEVMPINPKDSLNGIGTEKGNAENQQSEKIADSVEETVDDSETEKLLAEKSGEDEKFCLKESSAVLNKVPQLDSVQHKLENVAAEEITERHSIALPNNDESDIGMNRLELLHQQQETTLDDAAKRVKLNSSSSFKATPTLITSPKRFGYGPNSTKRIGYSTHTDLSGCDSNIKRRKLVKKHETTASEPKIPKTSPKQSSLTYILLSDSSDSSDEVEGFYKARKTRKKSKRASKGRVNTRKVNSRSEEKAPMHVIKEEPIEIEMNVNESITKTELNHQIGQNPLVESRKLAQPNTKHVVKTIKLKLPSKKETPTVDKNMSRRTRKRKVPSADKTVECSPKKNSNTVNEEEVSVHFPSEISESVHTQSEVSEDVHGKNYSLIAGKYVLLASFSGNRTFNQQKPNTESFPISSNPCVTSLPAPAEVPSGDSCDESPIATCCPLSIHCTETEVETPSFQSRLSPSTSEDSDTPTLNAIRLKSFVRDPYMPDSDKFSEGGTIVSKDCSKSQKMFSKKVGGKKRRIPGSSSETENLNPSNVKHKFQTRPSKDINTVPRKSKKFGLGHLKSVPKTLTRANKSSDPLKKVVDEIIRKTPAEKTKSLVVPKRSASRSKQLYTIVARATKVSLSRPARDTFPNLSRFAKNINQSRKKQTARMTGKWTVTELNEVTKIKTRPLSYRQPERISKAKRDKNMYLTMQKLVKMGLIVDQTPSRGNQASDWTSCSEMTKARAEYYTTCRNHHTSSDETMSSSELKISFQEPQMPALISFHPVVTPKEEFVWFTKDDIELKPCYVALKRLNIPKY